MAHFYKQYDQLFTKVFNCTSFHLPVMHLIHTNQYIPTSIRTYLNVSFGLPYFLLTSLGTPLKVLFASHNHMNTRCFKKGIAFMHKLCYSYYFGFC